MEYTVAGLSRASASNGRPAAKHDAIAARAPHSSLTSLTFVRLGNWKCRICCVPNPQNAVFCGRCFQRRVFVRTHLVCPLCTRTWSIDGPAYLPQMQCPDCYEIMNPELLNPVSVEAEDIIPDVSLSEQRRQFHREQWETERRLQKANELLIEKSVLRLGCQSTTEADMLKIVRSQPLVCAAMWHIRDPQQKNVLHMLIAMQSADALRVLCTEKPEMARCLATQCHEFAKGRQISRRGHCDEMTRTILSIRQAWHCEWSRVVRVFLMATHHRAGYDSWVYRSLGRMRFGLKPRCDLLKHICSFV